MTVRLVNNVTNTQLTQQKSVMYSCLGSFRYFLFYLVPQFPFLLVTPFPLNRISFMCTDECGKSYLICLKKSILYTNTVYCCMVIYNFIEMLEAGKEISTLDDKNNKL